MKNVFKKVSAIALAFTLLGSGTTIEKNVNPKSVNTLTANAACQYHRADNTYVVQKWESWYSDGYIYEVKYLNCNCCRQFYGSTKKKIGRWGYTKINGKIVGTWYYYF